MSLRQNDMNIELFAAVKTGDLVKVKELKVNGTQINCSNPQDNNYKPLHLASENGHKEIVYFLLSNDADPNGKADCNVTPLHLAAGRGHSDIVELLLKNFAEINAQNKEGSTPLLLAVKNEHSEVVFVLLNQGACVNTKDEEDNSPFYLAIEKKNWSLISSILDCKPNIDSKIKKSILRNMLYGYECDKIQRCRVVDYLIEYGFTVDQEDVSDCTILQSAVKGNYLKIVESLLMNGADLNDERCNSLLCDAVNNKDIEMVKLLLKSGCDINAENKMGYTPISSSSLSWRDGEEAKNEEIFLLLVANGADVKKALKCLDMFVEYGCCDACKILIDNGAEFNVLSLGGHAPLHKALCEENAFFDELSCTKIQIKKNAKKRILKLLLINGADVNLKTEYGATALHLASSSGSDEDVRMLLDFGANVNVNEENDRTPLHLACEKGHSQIVNMLLNNKAFVDALDINCRTPLQIAALEGFVEIVKILLKFGADIDARSFGHETALHLAILKQHNEVVTVLLENNCSLNDGHKETALAYAISTVEGTNNCSLNDDHGETASADAISTVEAANNCSLNDDHGETASADAISTVEAPYSPIIFNRHKVFRKESFDDHGYWRYDSEDDHFNEYYDDHYDSEDDHFNYRDDHYDDHDDHDDRYHYDDYDEDIYGNGWYECSDGNDNMIIKALKKHVIKLNVAGLYVDQRDLDLLNVSPGSSLFNFQQECEFELSNLNEKKLYGHLTVHDILVSGDKPVEVKSVALDEFFIFCNFPIYGRLTVNSYEGIKKTNELLTASPNWLSILIKTSNAVNKEKLPILPVELLEKIVSYLDKKDLRNLVFCSECLKHKVLARVKQEELAHQYREEIEKENGKEVNLK